MRFLKYLVVLALFLMDITLFEPTDMPITGLRTRTDAVALPQGYWKELQNVDWCGEQGIKVRAGLGPTLGTVGSGTPCGQSTLTVNGTVYHFIAMRSGGETLIYRSTDGVTWTEITAGIGQYGNTRFAAAGDVFFEVCKSNQFNLLDYVLIQNGTNAPRVWDGSAVSAISDPSAVSDLHNQTVYRSPGAGFDLQAAARSNSGANWTATVTGTSPDVYMALARNTTVDSGATITFDHGAAITSLGASFDRQFWTILECSDYTTFWANVKISVSTDNFASSNVTIYDPTSPSESKKQPPIVVPFSVTGTANNKGIVNLFAFSPSLSAMAQYRYSRLTWTGTTAPSASLSAKLYFIGFGGGNARLSGGSNFGVAYYTSHHGGFGKGVVYSNVKGRKLSEFGGTSLKGARFPAYDPKLYYRTDLPYRNTTADSNGYNYAGFFLQEEGAGGFYWFNNAQVTQYSAGSWSLVSGSSGDTLLKQCDEGLAQDYRIPLPSDQHRNIQPGGMMKWDGNRLFVCTTEGLDISRLDCPMYHRSSVDPNDAEFSGFQNRMNDYPVALASTSTPNRNRNQIYVLSNSWCYVTGGVLTSELSRMSRVAPHGTVNPYTVKEYLGQVFWVDQEMQVRRIFGGEPVNLSRFEVDDQLEAAGAKTNLVAEVFKDRYRVYYGTGSTNNRCLIWNIPFQKWESVHVYADHTVEYVSRWEASGVIKLLSVGSDGTVRLVDGSQNVDGASTPIEVAFTPWAIKGGPSRAQEVTIREVSLFGQQKAATFNVVRTFAPTNGTITGSMDFTTGSAFDWYTEDSLTTVDNGFGLYGTIRVSASTSNGMLLQKVTADVRSTNGGPSA